MSNNNSVTDKKYSKITLLPRDKDELRKFQNFRNDDVFYMFKIMCILATIEVGLMAFAFLYAHAVGLALKQNTIQLVYQSMVTLTIWLVWALGKRFPERLDVMIAASFAILSAILTVTVDFMAEFDDAELVMIYKLMGYMVLWVQFLAPSIFFLLFYAAVYLIAITTVVLQSYEERKVFLQFGYLMIIAYVTFWYLLHQRELKRFYEQQKAVGNEIKAVTKEIEVTNVLNLQ